MFLVDFLIGRPIPTSDERAQQIGVAKGIPIFGLDALSLAAYGPEAALTLLIPLGLAGLSYNRPDQLKHYCSASHCLSFLPADDCCVSGRRGRENLGTFAGLLAAAALMVDCVSVTFMAG